MKWPAELKWGFTSACVMPVYIGLGLPHFFLILKKTSFDIITADNSPIILKIIKRMVLA